MKTVTASNLRVQFTDILKDLSTGPVNITKHGKTIAVLTSPESPVKRVSRVAPTIDPFGSYEEPSEPVQALINVLSDDEDDEGEPPDWDAQMEADFDRYIENMIETNTA